MTQKLTLAKTHDHCGAARPAATVVMIHGIASDSVRFGEALEFLEGKATLATVRFVTFDLLGWGKSQTSAELNYSYAEQLTALHNAIAELKRGEEPLILVGHSMGTMIAARYATQFRPEVRQLILLSPPVYTEAELAAPEFAEAMQTFREKVEAKHPGMAESRSFKQAMREIVLDKRNYRTLAELETPAVLIWGEQDTLISSYNLPGLLAANPRLTAIRTADGHAITREKYTKLAEVLDAEVV